MYMYIYLVSLTTVNMQSVSNVSILSFLYSPMAVFFITRMMFSTFLQKRA